MTAHELITEDTDLAGCVLCGAQVTDTDPTQAVNGCTQRTDLIHTNDLHNSGHPLDCDEAAETGTCDHLAAAHGCDCLHCR